MSHNHTAHNEAINETATLFREVQGLAGQLAAVANEQARAFGLTAARWQVLRAVQDGPLTVPSAARRLGVSRQAVQNTADRLVTDGFAQYADNPDHARSSLVAVTAKGAGVLDDLAEAQAAWLAEVAEGMQAVNIRIATGVVRGLANGVEAAGS